MMLDEAPMGCENQLCCFSRKAKQPFLWWESLLDKQQDLPVDFHGSKAFGRSNAMHNCHLRCFKEFCTAACTTAVKSSSACLPITDWFSFLLWCRYDALQFRMIPRRTAETMNTWESLESTGMTSFDCNIHIYKAIIRGSSKLATEPHTI